MDDTIRVLILVALLIGLFLAIRSFWWWYWGIDRIVGALESIDASLKQLPVVQQAERAKRQRVA
jgi:hypothetical protein